MSFVNSIRRDKKKRYKKRYDKNGIRTRAPFETRMLTEFSEEITLESGALDQLGHLVDYMKVGHC
jgi:hypothetical protein